MNSAQAKKIQITDYLEAQNVLPKKLIHNGRTAIYLSPFRNEKTASFHVDSEKNVWFDHGIGVGGNIVDLVMRVESTDFKGALEFLENKHVAHPFSFHQQSHIPELLAPGIEILAINIIRHHGLKQYISSRKISLVIANQYLKEVHYKVGSNQCPYFAIGFINVLGGYELRNKYFKGSNSPKHYSFIKGRSDEEINVYEGFFDFLSALELSNDEVPHYDTLVLNSLSNMNKCVYLIAKYNQLNLFLDNDTAGINAAIYFNSLHCNVINRSEQMFPNFKDFNDFLIGTNRSKNIISQTFHNNKN